MIARNKTPSEYIYHGLYLYFSGLSLRRTSERLSYFIKRNHVTVWNWIQKYHPQRISSKSKRYLNLSLMRHCLKLGQNISGFGLQLSQKTSKFSHYQYLRRETCLLLKDLCQVWSSSWKSSRFNGWWYMVSAGLQILKTKTSYSFSV